MLLKNFNPRNLWQFVTYVANRFLIDGCNYRAAALTFTGLLSLVPLMSVSLTILTAFPVFKDVSGQVENFVFTHFVAGSGEVVQHYLEGFVEQASKLSMPGLIVLLVTAVLMMYTIEQAMNIIWRVQKGRKGISTFMLYWAILTLSPILMGVGIAASSYLFSLPLITGTAESFGLNQTLLLEYTPFLSSVLVFSLLYIAVPNCKVKISHGLAGAFFAAFLFEVAKKGFTYYLAHFPTYELIYGAMATIPMFLVWVYLTWMIVLLGAEVAQACAAYYERRSGKKLDGFTHAIRWLGHFWTASQKGASLSRHDLIKLDQRNYDVIPSIQLSELLNAKLIQVTVAGKYMLSRDLDTLTLEDVYRMLPWQLPSVDALKSSKDPWEKSLADIFKDFETARQACLQTPVSNIYQNLR